MSTITNLLQQRFSDSADSIAIYVKRNGHYEGLRWRQVQLDVERYAARFVDLGLSAGDRVAQYAENRYEWIVADLAMHSLGIVHVPIHATLSGPQVIQQVAHSEASLLIVASDALYDQVKELPLPVGTRVLTHDASLHVERFDDATLQPISAAEAAQYRSRVSPTSLATILYTSGTTGEPKGVMLNQRNLVTNARGTHQTIQQTRDDLTLAFLPLSHVFARTCDLYVWIVSGGKLALAESRDTIVSDAQAIRPTIITGVPYFFSSLQRILEVQGRADRPNQVNELLGGNMRFANSGGAALPADLYDFFAKQGTPIYQGYGLTESSPVISASGVTIDRRGAVGKPIPGVEVKIADDGEVLTRGDHVMQGYWNNQAATAEIIRDGWLHTGDLGRLDEDGFLYITGRKRDLIVTATGMNISPGYLEALLVAEPTIAQAMILGDNRRFLAALIVPDHEYVNQHEDVHSEEQLYQLIEQRIYERLATRAKYEQVVKFRLLDHPFSMERGEVTAKRSLRRDVIEDHYADEIAELYQ